MDERNSFGKEFQIFNPTTRIFLLKKKNFWSKIKSNKKTCTLGVGALIKFHILFSCSPRFVPYYDPSSFVVDHIPWTMGVVVFMFQFIRWRVLPIIIIIWGNDPFWLADHEELYIYIYMSILYMAYQTHLKCAILTQKGKKIWTR